MILKINIVDLFNLQSIALGKWVFSSSLLSVIESTEWQ